VILGTNPVKKKVKPWRWTSWDQVLVDLGWLGRPFRETIDMSMMKKLVTAGAFATALSTSALQASTIVVEDGVYDIGFGDTFAGLVISEGGAGSWQVQFNSVVDPLLANATATIGQIMLGNFTGLTMSWKAVSDGFTLSSILVTPPQVSLDTTFSVCGVLCFDDSKQWLVFSWSDSTAGAGFDFEVAAVPLPAAGFLLVGALGGLVALRRRKTA
jgi:hypothetical protein